MHAPNGERSSDMKIKFNFKPFLYVMLYIGTATLLPVLTAVMWHSMIAASSLKEFEFVKVGGVWQLFACLTIFYLLVIVLAGGFFTLANIWRSILPHQAPQFLTGCLIALYGLAGLSPAVSAPLTSLPENIGSYG